MKQLRRRKIALLYGWRYKRWSNKSGYWGLTKLDKSYGFSTYVPLSDVQFINKLKWYKKHDI